MDGETRRTVGIVVVVTVATVVASFGFWSVSKNPLAPSGAEVTVRDAPAEGVLEAGRTGRVVSVTNTGSEGVPMSEVEVVAWPDYGGVAFNRSANWTYEVGTVTLELVGGESGSRTDTLPDRFRPGDTLWIVKRSGRIVPDRIEVRIYHLPSKRTVASDSAPIE